MNHSVWTKGEPASLPEILDAREKRAQLRENCCKKIPPL